jgi:hypothetical protein
VAVARRRKPARVAKSKPAPVPPPVELTEEERIEAAKYLPRELPARLFEEERFLFPESYGQDRVRLLVKDPEWLFAHWDVRAESWTALRRELGERPAALARLSLRVVDPLAGLASLVLLPQGARGFYLRIEPGRRSYQAELGFTLPSGEFRSLASSNTVATPWVGTSPVGASRRGSYREPVPAEAPGAEPVATGGQVEWVVAGSAMWEPAPGAQAVSEVASTAAPSDLPVVVPTPAPVRGPLVRGGASDVFQSELAEGRGGASDVYSR